MKIHLRIMLMIIITISYFPFSSSQEHYSDFKTLSLRINSIAKEYPELSSVKSLVKTAGGKDIWLISIGTGDKDQKPGIAIVGGVEGNYMLGKELAIGIAEKLLKNNRENTVKDLLGKVTFYILPDVNPDASEQYFSGVKYERTVNARSVDEDRDFLFEEDPCEDLNKDGFISLIRIKDPSGKYIESTEDSRIMVEADLSKGQKGIYLVYTEGIDNDKDGSFNEDPEGGVNFNRNFSFNYESFGANAGLHPVSEPETKAVADFLFSRFNIYAVFAFGPQDNLGQPMKSVEVTESGQNHNKFQTLEKGETENDKAKITSILKDDEKINQFVSEKYHEITGAVGAPLSINSPGNFMEWAYYHYGRYSFSTPGWWFPVEKGKNAEAAFLKFAEKNRLKDVFIPWTVIQHPDFPGKITEVGGIKPFVIINPPVDTIGELTESHYKFITAIAAMHPELEFLDVKVENGGENIYRIILKIHNKGIFATCTEAGDKNIWTRIIRISAEPGEGQSILSGLKVQRVQRLQGDETAEFRWLVSGKGTMLFKAGAINVGSISTTVDLK